MARPLPGDADQAFGRSMYRLRAAKGWSQLTLAIEAGITTHATIGRIEMGNGCMLATAIAIATALDTDVTAMTTEADLKVSCG